MKSARSGVASLVALLTDRGVANANLTSFILLEDELIAISLTATNAVIMTLTDVVNALTLMNWTEEIAKLSAKLLDVIPAAQAILPNVVSVMPTKFCPQDGASTAMPITASHAAVAIPSSVVSVKAPTFSIITPVLLAHCQNV